MEALDKLKAITEGFENYAFPNEKMESKAKIRAEICSKCEHAVNTVLKALNQKNEEVGTVNGLKCDICKCFLPAKVRQEIQRCPIQKW